MITFYRKQISDSQGLEMEWGKYGDTRNPHVAETMLYIMTTLMDTQIYTCGKIAQTNTHSNTHIRTQIDTDKIEGISLRPVD